MKNIGLDYCQYFSFQRGDGRHFYIFPIGKFILGVVQRADIDSTQMLGKIQKLVSKVSTS